MNGNERMGVPPEVVGRGPAVLPRGVRCGRTMFDPVGDGTTTGRGAPPQSAPSIPWPSGPVHGSIGELTGQRALWPARTAWRIIEECYERGLAYVKRRRQFGRGIGEVQPCS